MLPPPALTYECLFECQVGYENELGHYHHLRSKALQTSPVCHTLPALLRREAPVSASQPRTHSSCARTTYFPHGLTRFLLFLRSSSSWIGLLVPMAKSPPGKLVCLCCVVSSLPRWELAGSRMTVCMTMSQHEHMEAEAGLGPDLGGGGHQQCMSGVFSGIISMSAALHVHVMSASAQWHSERRS